MEIQENRTILVTGGAGFIGCNFIKLLIGETPYYVVNVDKLTYAGNLHSLSDIENHRRYRFYQLDVCDHESIERLIQDCRPTWIFHMAAESHVDRSIDGPREFIQTNVVGTYTLLEAARNYWMGLAPGKRKVFRFMHVSTDEVYGSLGPSDPAFTEESCYNPRSPYSASKAASDHLARAWYHTYGLPVVVTNCSNNYGPYQFPEKLIPMAILRCLHNEHIPIYGNGENIRDWLYVGDHTRALLSAALHGRPGANYNFGGNNELRNIDVITHLCNLLDDLRPRADGKSYSSLIRFVDDRPGHDFRYSINSARAHHELCWNPREKFGSGFRKTVEWYLENEVWWSRLLGKTK